MTNKKGFTLIELLVVIVIIGLLATMALIALNSARAKGRDAKRVADVKQTMTALEMYYNDQNGYPVQSNIILGEGIDCAPGSNECDHLCSKKSGTSGSNGFIYGPCDANSNPLMNNVPSDPDPGNTALGGVVCSKAGQSGDYATVYLYNSTSASNYTINFCLEGSVNDLTNKCTASPAGVICGGTA